MDRNPNDAFAVLQQLERAVFEAESAASVRFVIVNQTQNLIAAEQAVLWEPTSTRVTAISGVAIVERDSPFTRWFTRLANSIETGGVRQVTAESLDDLEHADLVTSWPEYLAANLLVIPLARPGTDAIEYLYLARSTPFHDYELTLAAELSLFYAAALALYEKPRLFPRSVSWPGGRRGVALSLFVAAALLFPIRLSVLAPAEVVPTDPVFIRAPFDGVIETIHVEPYEAVEAGQSLVTFDTTEVRNRLVVAERALEIAQAEYRQAAQAAVFDRDSKLSVAIEQGRLAQREAELEYYRALEARLHVVAPKSGIAVFNDASPLIGRPVQTGETIFQVASPGEVELRFDLPVEDAISLEEGSPARLFLNVAPNDPVAANLQYVSFTATRNESGTLVYQGKATFTDDGETPRVGLRGTVKLYGARYPVFYWLLRKPLAYLRQVSGI